MFRQAMEGVKPLGKGSKAPADDSPRPRKKSPATPKTPVTQKLELEASENLVSDEAPAIAPVVEKALAGKRPATPGTRPAAPPIPAGKAPVATPRPGGKKPVVPAAIIRGEKRSIFAAQLKRERNTRPIKRAKGDE